jgi:hypothetical protein
MKRFSVSRLSALALACMLPFSGCINDGGTEVPNEIRGSLVLQNGQPAANATVTLYPVGYTPGSSVAKTSGLASKVTVQTNGQGAFTFEKIPDGEYNVIGTGADLYTLQDSVRLQGASVDLPLDTLRAPGSLTGTVRLQPQHSPQTVIVQVLGTDTYVNVDANGAFTLSDLPRGQYLLRVTTILPDYVPLFKQVNVRSGMNDTLTPVLEPFYAGVPVVTGLSAVADSDGIIHLKWRKQTLGTVQAYVIYRDNLGSVSPSTTPYASVTDTVFHDTLYAISPRSGQLHYLDDTPRSYSYRVRVRNASDDLGPVFGSVSATSVPPSQSHISGRWHSVANNLTGSSHPVVFQNKLWIFEGNPGAVRSSTDGATWQETATPAMDRVIGSLTFQGKIWVLTQKDVFLRNSLWSSPDGITWTKVVDSLNVPVRRECSFLEFNDKMWIVGGNSNIPQDPARSATPVNAIHYSADGLTWTNANPNAAFSGRTAQAAAAFSGKLWLSGGTTYEGISNNLVQGATAYFAGSSNGSEWTVVTSGTQQLLLPRAGHTLVAHGGYLWSLGGEVPYIPNPRNDPLIAGSAEAWRTADGTTWELVDAHAPFGSLSRVPALSFQNRLWIFRNNVDYTGTDVVVTTQIWYYE